MTSCIRPGTSDVNSHVIMSVESIIIVLLNLHIMITCLMCSFAGLKIYNKKLFPLR